MYILSTIPSFQYVNIHIIVYVVILLLSILIIIDINLVHVIRPHVIMIQIYAQVIKYVNLFHLAISILRDLYS